MRTRLLLLGGLATAGLALAVAERPAPTRPPAAKPDFAALPAWDVGGQLWKSGDRPETPPQPPTIPTESQPDASGSIWATPATFSASD